MALWWQWGLQTPSSVNPLLDTTGQNCTVNQSGSVWFLGGSFSLSPITRACTFPPNTALLYPLINLGYFAFLSDPPEQRTEEYICSQVTCIEDSSFSTVKIDGAAVGNPKQYLEKSVIFDVILPKDNIFGAKNNVIPKLTLSPSVDESYYLLVFPLAPGQHTLQWKASGCGGAFSQDITYNLTVK